MTTTTNMSTLGETVLINFLREGQRGGSAVTTVVVRPLNTSQHVYGEFYLFVFISHSFSLLMSHSGHVWTIVYAAPMISCSGWRYCSVSSVSVRFKWTCRNMDKMNTEYSQKVASMSVCVFNVEHNFFRNVLEPKACHLCQQQISSHWRYLLLKGERRAALWKRPTSLHTHTHTHAHIYNIYRAICR